MGSSVSARLTETMPNARRLVLVLVLAMAALAMVPASGRAADPCAAPVTNPVACENSKPGTPMSDWEVTGVGDASIQGFATRMSVNVGQPISFKVDTSAAYHVDILRMGYYDGDGARKIASNLTPTARNQPSCLTVQATGLIDCGNWAVSAHVDGPEHRGVGRLHRPSRPQRQRR